MELINLTGKTALVTGGSRGVGAAAALTLAGAGADVGISYISRQKEAEEIVRRIREMGRRSWCAPCDLANEVDIRHLFDRLDLEFPAGLDIYIANAGIWPPESVPLTQMTKKQWKKTMAINLDAVFLTTLHAGKRLHDGGKIVYVGSTAGQRGEAFHSDYAASKGALISVVKSLCIEFAPRDITVNCVAPGWIDTEMSEPAFADNARERIAASIPLGRIATAEDVAGPIVFLCSDLARHITGEVLNINGGAVLCG